MDEQPWRVEYHRNLEKDMRQLPRPYIARLLAKIESLAIDPRPPGSERLAGFDFWKVRVGPYRIIYTIDEQARIVRTFRIDHRREVYRDL
jgi:mRNA interferase RelE/StbE